MAKYDRLNIDIQGLRESLEAIASEEQRSLSNLARILIIEALAVRGINIGTAELASKIFPDDSIHSVVERNINKLKRAGIGNLRAIANSEVLPTVADFAKIAAALGLTEQEQQQLWHRTFSHYPYSDQKPSANGHP